MRKKTFLASILAFAAVVGTWAPAEGASECKPTLRYAFQPDCYRPSLAAPCDSRKTGDRLDMGPQVAVWLETMDGQYKETLMVTNLVAKRGLGNRPGAWNLPSSPKFPYGKRTMALPIWAHARNKRYDTVVMQDGDSKESWLGFHEAISSPDPYYCRPMTLAEIDVDAISCPTVVFNSAKGRFSTTMPQSFYPPRNDLFTFTPRDCDMLSSSTSCESSSTKYAELNDLDAVAAATPNYGSVFRGVWDVPADFPEAEYALMVEVGKEFDNNAHHAYPAYQDPQLQDSGLRNNFGQPSVVYRVPIVIDHQNAHQGATTDIAAYGDWNGDTGERHPPDVTITDAPGSGRGRLLVIEEPGLAGGPPFAGRVHASTDPPRNCAGSTQSTGEVASLAVPPELIAPTEVQVRFLEASDAGGVVQQYEIKYLEGFSMTAENFQEGTAGPQVVPLAPGAEQTFKLDRLKPDTQYVLGVRARGCCIGDGPLVTIPFKTAVMKFKQLSGCFIATAAFGSDLEAEVGVMRRLRDQVRDRSAWGKALVDIYERSSPPVAALLRESDVARAAVRQILGPLAGALGSAQ